MKRKTAVVAATLMIGALCFGCGDKGTRQAKHQWKTYKSEQIKTMINNYGEENLSAADFSCRMKEVKGTPYQMLAFIGFSKGNTFLEKSYAFVNGSWQEVTYSEVGTPEALKKTRKATKKLQKKIRHLEKRIRNDEKRIEERKDDDKDLAKRRTQLQVLQDELNSLAVEAGQGQPAAQPKPQAKPETPSVSKAPEAPEPPAASPEQAPEEMPQEEEKPL